MAPGSPNTTPDQRAAYKVKADQITTQGDSDKLENANALGLSTAEMIKLGNDISAALIKASNAVAEANQKDQAAQQKLQKKNDSDVAHEAEGAIKSLGPNKQELELAHAAAQELSKGDAKGAATLSSVLTQLVSTAKNLTSSQTDLFKRLADRLTQVDTTLRDHKTLIDRLHSP